MIPKINATQNLSFKSLTFDQFQSITKKTKAQEPPSPFDIKPAIPRGIYLQYFYNLDKTKTKSEIEAECIAVHEFNIKTKQFQNNTHLLIDDDEDNQQTTTIFELSLVNQIEKNPAVELVLDKLAAEYAITSNDRYLLNSENEFLLKNYLSYENSTLKGEIEAENSRYLEGLEKEIDLLFNPSFTQEDLEKAKKEALEQTSLFNAAKKALNVVYDYKEPTKEEIEKVTLDDVKNLYNQILANSRLKIATSLPAPLYNQEKQNIFNLIETKIPKMQPADKKPISQIKPLDTNHTFREKTPDIILAEKFFVINDNNTLKDDIKLQILSELFNLRASSVFKDKTEGIPNSSACDKYLELYSTSEDKNISADELENNINVVIKSLIDTSVTKEELKKAKEEVCDNFEDDYSDNKYRPNVLLENYSDGLISVKKAQNILNSLTIDEMQQMIKTQLTKPSSTGVLY